MTETRNELGTEEMMMVTVNVIVIERKIGMSTENVKVTGIGIVIAIAIAIEEIVTEENATVVNAELGREIEEVVTGIVEAGIGIMTENETGRESTSDGLVHVKESGRGKFQA